MVDTSLLIPQVIKSFFSSKDLERRTEKLDNLFDGLNLKDLPEYQSAIDALRNYGDAAATRYSTERQKRSD